MAKKIGVLLSGCGVFDGAEIHESVITLLKLDQADAKVTAIAPDINQLKSSKSRQRRRCFRIS